MAVEKQFESPLVETVPMWLAVALTVVASMPFGLWLGKYNFALWCSFIVWAEYFALGAKPAVLRLIVPAFSYAVVLTALTLWAARLLDFLPALRTKGDLAMTAALFVGIALTVYTMRFSRIFQEGSLPFFNGISMALAIYFTGSYPDFGGALPAPIAAGAWTVLMGLFGSALGVFNVWITFPRPR